MLKRYTPLKRSTKPLKRTPLKRSAKRIARVSKRRRRERAEYAPTNREYLFVHPICQLSIARHRFVEAEVLAALEASRETGQPGVRWALELSGSWYGFFFNGVVLPWATEVHHRNKCNGARLTDERWFASAGREMHDWVEANKTKAREEGYLLPFEADKDGRLPNGTQCLTTAEWLVSRSRK